MIWLLKRTGCPSVSKVNNSRKPTVKYAEMYKNISQSPKVMSSNFGPPIIEDWDSEDESEVTFTLNKTVRPSIEQMDARLKGGDVLDQEFDAKLIRYDLGLILYRDPCAIKGVLSLDLSKVTITLQAKSGGTMRVMETPSFGFHHMASPRPAAYSPKEVRTPFDLEDIHACFQSSNNAVSDHLHVYILGILNPDHIYI
ncbi:hypothetical protein Tco_0873120 [Tanacetum coccineum]